MSSDAVTAEQTARAIVDGAANDRALGREDALRWVDSDTVAELLRIIDFLRKRAQ